MAHRCALCGADGATCGPRTVTMPVDAKVTGKVMGGIVVPVSDSIAGVVGEMSSEEAEEFAIMMQTSEGRKLRNQVMADGLGHTSLVYVRRPDGVTEKMTPEAADKYVELTEGAEIVRRGTRPQPASPEEGETIGATKARIGPMFDDKGRQNADVQPMTTRTFMAEDSNADHVRTPSIGGTGAHASEQTSTPPARPRMQKPAAE